MKVQLKNNQGVAMVVVIVMMVILLSITGSALLFSGINLKASANLNTGGAALHVADGGIQHALAIIPSGTDFDTLLSGSVSNFPLVSGKPTLTGSLSGYTYTVVVENDTTVTGETTSNDTNKIVILTSTATGPNSSSRKVKAYIGRSSSPWIPPGAVYIPGQAAYVETAFTGTSFEVSGNDTNVGGSVGSGSGSDIPGITTSDSAMTTEISGAGGSLASNQYARVTGQGTSPNVSTGSTILDVEQLAQDILARGVEGVDKQTKAAGTYQNEEWGTSAVPKITNITGNAILQGTLAGYGVLIVDGDLSTKQGFTWRGVVIARGNADIHGTASTDGATIWGTLLIKKSTSSDSGQEFDIGGPSRIYYSTEAINVVLGKWSSAFPQAAKLAAWNEVMQ